MMEPVELNARLRGSADSKGGPRTAQTHKNPARPAAWRRFLTSSLRVNSVVGVFVLLCTPFAGAQDQAALPLWEIAALGVGVSQQAYPGASARVERLLALPFFVYRGRILRADRSGAGIRALKTADFELDVGVASSFGSNAENVAVRRGMPDLGTLVEIGPRLIWKLGAAPGGGRWQAEFPLRAVFDLSEHLTRRGAVFEPTMRFERRGSGDWRYHTSFGALVGDRRLADTFYGVAPAYQTPQRPAYTARTGLIAWRLATTLTYRVTPDLNLFGLVRVDSVAGAANATSPLVERRTGASLGLGLTYVFARSQRGAED